MNQKDYCGGSNLFGSITKPLRSNSSTGNKSVSVMAEINRNP